MNFITIEFLIFFPLTLLVYEKLPKEKRRFWLLAISLLFYFYWNHWSILLLLGVTVFTFLCGKQIANARKGKNRAAARGWLLAACLSCIGLLFIIKYAGLGFALPVGISFYTFQTISYVVDVYRGTTNAEESFSYYTLYVTFFPQLVAGPIERSGHLLSQLHAPKTVTRKMKMEGFAKLLLGFYKKIVIADFISPYVETVYENPSTATGPLTVIATALFAFQIYCDFSGYSDIAIGAAKMMGIELMENFNQPYLAKTFRDFWQRWHISLTKWFTDYVYKPLGGSRKGLVRTCLNILMVFTLSGIWHGAGLTFLLWGLIHGICLAMERWITSKKPDLLSKNKAVKVVYRLFVIVMVLFAWIFFRANTTEDAIQMLAGLSRGWSVAGLTESGAILSLTVTSVLRIMFSIALLLPLHKAVKSVGNYEWTDSEEEGHIKVYFTAAVAFVFVIAAAWIFNLYTNTGNTFIYFEF